MSNANTPDMLAHSMAESLLRENNSLRAENTTLSESVTSQALLIASLKEENAAIKDNNCTLRSTLELAQLALANYFEATRHMPKCEAIDQSAAKAIKDALISIPAPFNPDWSRLEAARESLREYMQLISDTQRQNAKLKEDNEQAYISLSIEGVRPNSLREGIAELMQRVGEAEKDAERYRWARRNIDANNFSPCVEEDFAAGYPEYIDSEIDAAIAASKVSNEVASPRKDKTIAYKGDENED